MLGPDSPQTVRRVVDEAVKLFGDVIDGELARLAADIDAEIIRLLEEKIAVLMLADLVTDHPQIPYISIWQSGGTEITQVYLSPRIVDLLGYSAEEVLKVRYANLTGDRIVSFFEEQHHLESKSTPRETAEAERRQEFLGNRIWKGFYRVRRKDGNLVWVMDKAVLTKFVNQRGNNVVYLSEGILLEAEEMMERIKTAR